METDLPNKNDLSNSEDVRQMVDSFYDRIRCDALLGPIFAERVDSWETHLPTMYSFWESMLFHSSQYSGNPFAKHISLPIEHRHFEQWLALFSETIDSLFAGTNAERAKEAAKSIAHSFQLRMGINPFGAPPSTE